MFASKKYPSIVLIALFTLISFSTDPSQAETIVGGSITSDTVWNLAGSPYIVTSDVTVEASVTRAYFEKGGK